MFTSKSFWRAMPLLFAGLFTIIPAQAAIFTVGPVASGCTHPTIPSAVAAAEANPGADTIRATRAVLYNAQELIISTQQNLNLVGGFASCTSTTSDGVQTVLDGAGGNAAPVLRISANAAATVIKLRLLRITGGDSTGDGGGIRFTGQGTLELIETTMNLNVADAGGGIHVRGSGTQTLLLVSNDNLIAGNRARSGGGIYLEGAEMLMVAPGSSIFANEATETGGGLRIHSDDERSTVATIGSTGFQSLAAIEGNIAAVGGGVAIFASEIPASLQLEGASPGAPVIVRENFASQRGGAIDLQPTEGLTTKGTVRADLLNAVLDGNAAPTGAAVYASNDSFAGNARGGQVGFKNARVIGHVSETSSNVATDGPIIVLTENSSLSVERSVMADNQGGPVVRSGGALFVNMYDSLLSGNAVLNGVLSLAGESRDRHLIVGSSIVDNTIGTGPVILADDEIELRNSIIWQPGTVSLQAGNRIVDDVLASEIASLGSSTSIVSAAPRFVDPEAGDYRLQAASPAIDFSGAASGPGTDLNGTPRGIDLPRVVNFNGTIDLGAHERGALGNLALNGQFLADRRLWDAGTPGATATWVATGAANGGSVSASMVAAPGGSFTGLRHCVRIPGPGRYRLTGSAYGSGADSLTRDDVSLVWHLRYNTGGESCSGTINAQGSVEFNNTASWSVAPTPGIIEITPAQFSRFSNVEILLQVREGSLNVNATSTGYFDEITLEADDSFGDALFANGFES